MVKPRKVLVAGVFWIWAVGDWTGVASAAAQAKVLTEFMNRDELQGKIELWRKARETYYSMWYEKRLSIVVTSDAREMLVGRYVERTVPPEFAGLERSVIRAVIQSDMGLVLDRSFIEKVTTEHKAVAFFISGVTLGKIKDVTITIEALRRALEQEDCRVIPCDPKKCPPDTCTSNAFRRFLPPP